MVLKPDPAKKHMMTTRRRFLVAAGASLSALVVPIGAGLSFAEPRDEQWLANHTATRLLDGNGRPMVWVPQFSRLRLMRPLRNGVLEVWVPRFSMVGRIPASAVGPVATPGAEDLAREVALSPTPPLIESVGLPARVIGGANARIWPAVKGDTLLTSLGHNAPLRALSLVEGDDGDGWYNVNWLDPASLEVAGQGYIHNSLVRVPRLPYLQSSPDQQDRPGQHFEADLLEPAMLVAFENGAPIWSTLTLKGTQANRTPTGYHQILWRVPNETMTSERVYPPIPRNAPGGYYLKNVLWTQYFSGDGASIHYNYWSSNWGYAGSHGCLGIAYNEARWAWDWSAVGMPVYVFA